MVNCGKDFFNIASKVLRDDRDDFHFGDYLRMNVRIMGTPRDVTPGVDVMDGEH